MKPQVVGWELGKRIPSNAIVASDSGTITTWGGGPEDVASAELLVSELVTNAVLYGYGAEALTLKRERDRLRICVSDRSVALPTPRAPTDDAEIGLGMQLIAAYASAWGVEPDENGKTVWCEVVISGR